MKLKYIKYTFLASVTAFCSCTDLEPEIYSDVLKDNYFTNDEQFGTLVANAYSQLLGEYGYVYREGYWSMQEYTADAVIVPTRGSDWWDNGVPIMMHGHSWEYDTRDINNGWSFAYGGVGKCNEVLDNIVLLKGDDESNYEEGTKSAVAETKILRAFFHMLAMDLYGSVAIVRSSSDAPKQYTRKEVFDFIEQEIKDNIDELPVTRNYGRITKGVAHAILAKLYLNAGVYSGSPRWQDCINECDSVMKDIYDYELDNDYFNVFAINNTNNREIIFPIVFDATYAKGNMFHLMTLHYVQQDVYGFTTSTWNGPCTTHKYLDKFEDNDLRKSQFFYGEIRDKSGKLMSYTIPADKENGVLEHLVDAVITPDITTIRDITKTNTFEGARFVKFEIEDGIDHHANNDFPIYRLADIYLMKAEAEIRLNGSVSDITNVNKLRNRAGVKDYTLGTLSLDEIIEERARELAWEGHRRQDLVRFGMFTGSKYLWPWKGAKPADNPTENIGGKATAETRNLFPIPKWVRDANAGVYQQNPGY